MRGFLQPAVKPTATENQTAFTKMARGRRTKLAKGAQTTLVKADQWAHGGKATAEVAEALDRQVKALAAKKK